MQLLVVAILVTLNMRGVRSGARLLQTITVVKLVPLLVFILIGVFFIDTSNLAWASVPTAGTVLNTAGIMIYAFSGIEGATVPSGEVKNPARTVPVDYNPRFASKKKRYRYRLLLDKVRDPLLRDRAWRIGYDLDMEKMRREARAIVGTHDFAAFRSTGDERDVTTRTVYAVTVEPDDDSGRVWSVVIEGNAFLYNMVRAIVGTLVEVGRGKRDITWPAAVLAARDRRQAGQTAPPHGLFLVSVDY